MHGRAGLEPAGTNLRGPYIAPAVASAGRLSEQSDMYSLAMVLAERCPPGLRDCFDPVLRECLRPSPADRPRSALDMATRLRTCKPPHHRFRAIVKYTALALASAVFVYGIVMFGSYHTRRERSQRLYPGEITAGAHYRSGTPQAPLVVRQESLAELIS